MCHHDLGLWWQGEKWLFTHIYTPSSSLHSYVFVLLATERINRSSLDLVVCSGKVVFQGFEEHFLPSSLRDLTVEQSACHKIS